MLQLLYIELEFFVQSIFADQYVPRTGLWKTVESRISLKKIFVELQFYRRIQEVKK